MLSLNKLVRPQTLQSLVPSSSKPQTTPGRRTVNLLVEAFLLTRETQSIPVIRISVSEVGILGQQRVSGVEVYGSVTSNSKLYT